MIIPIRTTGRHEGMHSKVENLFPIVLQEERQSGGSEYELAILELEVVAKREGIGCVDESGYRLYKIGSSICVITENKCSNTTASSCRGTCGTHPVLLLMLI